MILAANRKRHTPVCPRVAGCAWRTSQSQSDTTLQFAPHSFIIPWSMVVNITVIAFLPVAESQRSTTVYSGFPGQHFNFLPG